MQARLTDAHVAGAVASAVTGAQTALTALPAPPHPFQLAVRVSCACAYRLTSSRRALLSKQLPTQSCSAGVCWSLSVSRCPVVLSESLSVHPAIH